VKTAKVLCGALKPISSGGLKSPATHFASIHPEKALHILNLMLRETDNPWFFAVSPIIL